LGDFSYYLEFYPIFLRDKNGIVVNIRTLVKYNPIYNFVFIMKSAWHITGGIFLALAKYQCWVDDFNQLGVETQLKG